MISTGYSNILNLFKSDVSCLMCHGESWAAWKPGMSRPLIVHKWNISEPWMIPGKTYYRCGCGRHLQKLPLWVDTRRVRSGEGRGEL